MDNIQAMWLGFCILGAGAMIRGGVLKGLDDLFTNNRNLLTSLSENDDDNPTSAGSSQDVSSDRSS